MTEKMVPPAAVHAQPPTNLDGANPPPAPQAAVARVAASGGRRGGSTAAGFTNSSLYVGDLEETVDENRLYDLFGAVAPVLSVRVCRDQSRHVSLGYAYVNFSSHEDASKTRDALNFTIINGKPIRIMFCHRDPSLRRSGYGNLFVKNLDSSIDSKTLYETFAAFGTVLSCKLAIDNNGKSKGYGFVQYESEEPAKNAIKELNGTLIKSKQIYVGTFVRRQERNQRSGSPLFTNVYVKNFSEGVTDEDLKKMFEKFGPITSSVVMKDENGKGRCFGFVNFENPDSALAAIENLNGSLLDDKVLYVGKAEKKEEREEALRTKFQQERNSKFEKLRSANLYLKNLDHGISEEKLKDLFSEFGSITSCKVMVDQNGASKGAGFVAFSTPEEATKALNEMSGKMVGRKPLYVAVAQKKEERKAWLQAYFAQMRRLPQQEQPYMRHIPPQAAGYGFQPHQNLSGIHSGRVPSNYIMPFQGQSAQWLGSRRGGNYAHSHPQQRNSNQGLNRYMVNSRNGINASIVAQSMLGSMIPLPFDPSSLPQSPLNLTPSMPLSTPTLASALVSASPENQHLMLGEQLFPLVERLERKHAGKVTGMLLEMDYREVLHLIESPDALKKKVAEAMEVLRLTGSSDMRSQFRSYS